MTGPFQGYAEGYYGQLLSWPERVQILDTLQRLNLNTYYYAPKEDPWHRLEWRTAYAPQWRDSFRDFCEQAARRGICVVAGVAPGLNFDFSHLPDGRDFQLLKEKCEMLLIEGADYISLLMDDIDADFEQRSGQFTSEGAAHAALANTLAQSLTRSLAQSVAQSVAKTSTRSPSLPSIDLSAQVSSLATENEVDNKVDSDCSSDLRLWVTPRIYADELIEEAPEYLHDFVATLDKQHIVLYCGSDVVARQIDSHSTNNLRVDVVDGIAHDVVIWDNLYANDYCPRRLFVGPWRLRCDVQNIVLNPTGMVNTDCLLLELMARELHANDVLTTGGSENGKVVNDVWQQTLLEHDVPEPFFTIAPYFLYPVFNQSPNDTEQNALVDNDAVRAAIEHCLWRWKTPLSREWYLFLFGLKHDLLTQAGDHPTLRISKTQPRPLSDTLMKLQR